MTMTTPKENGLHSERPSEALCKHRGSIPAVVKRSLEQVSCNRIITTNTYNQCVWDLCLGAQQQQHVAITRCY